MVSIIPSGTPSSLIGADVGRALQNVLPQAVGQGYNRGMLQKSLGNIKDISKDPNASPLDMLLATLQAGAGIPGSERYLAQLAPELMKFAQARRSQESPLAGEEQMQSRDRSPIDQQTQGQGQQLPNFLNQQQQPNQFFPNNIGAQGGPGNVPQAATTGQKRPILTREEKIPAAKQLSKQRTDAGIPTTAKEALDEINAAQEEDRLYNSEVDKELKQRVEGQKNYGQKAVDYLHGVYDKSTPEMDAIFQKKGEEAAKRGDSEAEINRYLANEAKHFKNAIVNAEKDVSAPRLLENIASKVQGNYKNFEKAASDVTKHLQPLIDLGLYDTARGILRDKGYGVEEREAVLHPLSNQSKSIINQIPKYVAPLPPYKGGKFARSGEKPEVDLNPIKSSLIQMQQDDPNFSPVLARKAFEDKGYDWKDFGNAWNELLKEGFTPSVDQKTQSGNLDSPPLNFLDKILHGLNLIGR